MVHFTGLLENARHPGGGPCGWTLLGDPCKNWLPARIGGWPGTATGGQIHVVHISHTHPPKELIQALRKYLLGKSEHFFANKIANMRKCLTKFSRILNAEGYRETGKKGGYFAVLIHSCRAEC